jgi:hypothetical protein
MISYNDRGCGMRYPFDYGTGIRSPSQDQSPRCPMPIKSAAEWFAEMPDDDDAAWTAWLHMVQTDALEAAAKLFDAPYPGCPDDLVIAGLIRELIPKPEEK